MSSCNSLCEVFLHFKVGEFTFLVIGMTSTGSGLNRTIYDGPLIGYLSCFTAIEGFPIEHQYPSIGAILFSENSSSRAEDHS